MAEESNLMRTAREASEQLARDAATWSPARRDYVERVTGSKLPEIGGSKDDGGPKPAPQPDSLAVEAVLAKVIDVRSPPKAEGDWLLRRIDGAYAERTLMILALCTLFPAGLKKAPVRGMSDEYATAVYVDTPAGQLSWHIREDDLPAFAHLPEYRGGWDGHSTAEKYRRLTSPKFGDTEERKALAFYSDGFEYAGQDDNVSPEPTDELCEDAGRKAWDALGHRFRHLPGSHEAALAAGAARDDETGPKGPGA